MVVDGPTPTRWNGLRAAAEGWRECLSSWEDWRVEVEEFRELDGDRVLVFARNAGRGKASGMDVERMAGKTAPHIRHGKVTRLVAYFDRERALADLDLGPGSG